jgi:DNA repair protein RecO (recombination protein O)
VRLYFELWLLRLAGYLPEWTNCRRCDRSFEADEAGDLQADFHLLCKQCRRSQGAKAVTGRHREVFQKVQTLAPAEFAIYAADRSDAVADVSEILKRIISSVLGREVAGEKSFAVNLSK